AVPLVWLEHKWRTLRRRRERLSEHQQHYFSRGPEEPAGFRLYGARRRFRYTLSDSHRTHPARPRRQPESAEVQRIPGQLLAARTVFRGEHVPGFAPADQPFSVLLFD